MAVSEREDMPKGRAGETGQTKMATCGVDGDTKHVKSRKWRFSAA